MTQFSSVIYKKSTFFFFRKKEDQKLREQLLGSAWPSTIHAFEGIAR